MPETKRVILRTRRTEPFQANDFDFNVSNLPAWANSYHHTAYEIFCSLPLPTVQEEAWRRTDLRHLPVGAFRLPNQVEHLEQAPVPDGLLQPLTAEVHGGEVVLMPGGHQVQVSPELEQKGVVFTDLGTAFERYPHLVEKILGRIVRPDEGKFAALAGALAQSGVLLYVPRGISVEQPLHSLVWGAGSYLAHLSHLLVYLDEGASATYVHESASPFERDDALHAGIVEIFVGPSASLQFVELQSWGEHVWNFSHERAHLERGARLDWIFGAIGSRLTKNFSEINLAGEGSLGKMSGFYFTNHSQHLDHDTQQNHLAPHTTSDLLFKGALLDQSRSVWQGMIYVAPGADKTDGYQANRNLVLSHQARADSIPGLEILADDVRCTHGATVGRIDPGMVFYLLSRGIPKIEAQRLIVEGFFDPIMQRIPFDGVRSRFERAIHEKMETFMG